MKTYCILTFGTSDVQINTTKELPEACTIEIQDGRGKLKVKSGGIETEIRLIQNRDFKNLFLLAEPRNGGKSVLDNIGILGRFIDMPLTIPLIKTFHKEEKIIEKFANPHLWKKDYSK